MTDKLKEHVLKVHSTPLADLISGAKTGEVRNDDRGFKVGHTVRLMEVHPDTGNWTGAADHVRTISHIQRGYGLPDGLCVLSYAAQQMTTTPAARDEREPVIHQAFIFSDNPRLQALLPQGAIICGPEPVEVVLASDYALAESELAELRAELDNCVRSWGLMRAENEQLRAEVEACVSALPGVTYMDPPDGGAPSIPEQLRRMARDAARYRWLRMADWWESSLCAITNPRQNAKLGSDCPSRDRLDTAVDAAMSAVERLE